MFAQTGTWNFYSAEMLCKYLLVLASVRINRRTCLLDTVYFFICLPFARWSKRQHWHWRPSLLHNGITVCALCISRTFTFMHLKRNASCFAYLDPAAVFRFVIWIKSFQRTQMFCIFSFYLFELTLFLQSSALCFPHSNDVAYLAKMSSGNVKRECWSSARSSKYLQYHLIYETNYVIEFVLP